MWDFILGSRFSFPDPVRGTYTPMSGDYLGDGFDDIVWLHSGGFNPWIHRPSGTSVLRLAYTITFDSAAVASASATARTDAGTGISLPSVVPGTQIASPESTRD